MKITIFTTVFNLQCNNQPTTWYETHSELQRYMRSTRELNQVGWQAMQQYPSLGSAVYAIYSALMWQELILLYSFQRNGDVVPVLNTFHAFLTSSPSGSEWSASSSGDFTPGDKSSVHIAQHAAWPPQTSWTPQQTGNFLSHPGIEHWSPVRNIFIILTEFSRFSQCYYNYYGPFRCKNYKPVNNGLYRR